MTPSRCATAPSPRRPVLQVILTLASAMMILLASLVFPLAPSVTEAKTPEAMATAESTPMASPAAGGTSVTIFTWECVSATLTGQPMSYYLGEEQCEGVKLDVVFDVTDDAGTQQTPSVENGRQVDGLVGEIAIEQTLPDGYENPAIFCTPVDGQSGEGITGSGNAVTLPADQDRNYQCSFFNIPAGVSATGTGDVWVDTYVCASTPPADSTYAWYHQNCRTRQDGATFTLNTPGGETDVSTGDVLDGAASMRGLEPGNYFLDETGIIPNYQIGAVFCAEIGKVDIPGPAQMMRQDVDGTTITAPVTADMLFYCQWYHVPADPDATPVSGESWRHFGIAPRETGTLLLAA